MFAVFGVPDLSEGGLRAGLRRLRQVVSAEESPQTVGISAAISEQRARVLRAERDYDAEVIEGHDLKRIRDAAEARINEMEAQRLMSGRAGGLISVSNTENPARTFRDASLDVRREVIDILATVTLFSQPKGRKGFNPDSVEIEWHASEPTTLPCSRSHPLMPSPLFRLGQTMTRPGALA